MPVLLIPCSARAVFKAFSIFARNTSVCACKSSSLIFSYFDSSLVISCALFQRRFNFFFCASPNTPCKNFVRAVLSANLSVGFFSCFFLKSSFFTPAFTATSVFFVISLQTVNYLSDYTTLSLAAEDIFQTSLLTMRLYLQLISTNLS